jgi:hypothetical protein
MSARLAAMRSRVTLMGEVQNVGAGGRVVITTPIIAEVWAEVLGTAQSQPTEAEGRRTKDSAVFRFHYAPNYWPVAYIKENGRLYKVTSKSKTDDLVPAIEVQARSVKP